VLIRDDGKDISTQAQQYDPTSIINEVRSLVEEWRRLPQPHQWNVTPETQRLLQHWRHHRFQNLRPFFCQVEAAETIIWLTEVAPNTGKRAKGILEHLQNANNDANPELLRAALKLATGAARRPSWRCSSRGRRSTPLGIRRASNSHAASS
jgi:type III restriction enzyme